jgi:hypothetical protein
METHGEDFYANPTLSSILEAVPRLHWRRCWECHDAALFSDNKLPECRCRVCGSEDTRPIKKANELLQAEAEKSPLHMAEKPPGLIYLATPYSHDDPEVRQKRFEVVNSVAAKLLSQGLHVYSPISHTHPVAMAGDLPKTWEFWETYDRAFLSKCSLLLVLRQDGWQNSVGVKGEIAIAHEYNIPVNYMDP